MTTTIEVPCDIFPKDTGLIVADAFGAQIVTIVVNLVALYGARLALYFALYPVLGPDALWWSFNAGVVLAAILTVLAYTRGPWARGTRSAPASAPADA